MWDHKLILIDPKPRNYRKSRGAGSIRMRFEPPDGATTQGSSTD